MRHQLPDDELPASVLQDNKQDLLRKKLWLKEITQEQANRQGFIEDTVWGMSELRLEEELPPSSKRT